MSIYNDLVSFLSPMVGGGVALAIGLSISKKTRKLKETGLAAEGIVFNLENGDDRITVTKSDDFWSFFNARYPVIRFLTADQVWITGKPSSFAHNLYKAGQTVKVIYNKEDPAEFIIDSKLNTVLSPLLQGAGVILLIIGLVVFAGKI
ncbi:MAG: DUF3592 domain-containing protein [Chitinophagaceae bacterium]|nr:MAG: DUF3592 domain-containing protein [Chitinophagaceae bacterium]